MSPDSEQIQRVLDEAFAKFRTDYPEVARTIEALNVSYAEYLRVIVGLNGEIQTVSGDARTPLV